LDVRSGEGRKFESLMLVLDGNIPRFPWEPSTTMLTYRLKALQRQRRPTGTDTPVCTPDAQHAQEHAAGATTSSLAPASTPKVLCDADAKILELREDLGAAGSGAAPRGCGLVSRVDGQAVR
jgi:hypothetical protein